MRLYTAHVHATTAPALVREGWSWGAFVFGAFWLAAHRAWLPALLWVALSCVPLILPPGPGFVLGCALAVLAGLLGRDLVRWSLARRGYTLAHIVAAPDGDAALARLLAAREDLVPRFLPRPETGLGEGWRLPWAGRR